ncbi:met regulon transcriptional regulator MetJ [Tahibacter sp.]|uniref:met regulon transcriptional regulator MetJ n=1 Tax=Tahibacter sp. TaxID=2056211 RepID=UPI0031BB6D4E
MSEGKYIDPYVEHGSKSEAVRKITVSIPMHILRLLSDERTRRQVANLRHATNSDLLCEAFLHAFTGQPLPTDEELRRMAMKKATAKKPAAKKAAKKVTAKKAPAKKVVKAKAAPAKKVAKKAATKKVAAKKVAKKATVKKAVAKKAPAKKAAPAKAARATKAAKPAAK